MLRPEEMTRAVIVGSIESLDATIESLYELGVLHLIDFTKQDDEFKLGQPLPEASAASRKLLKLRAMIRTLEIEGHRPKKGIPSKDIDTKIEQAIVTLDLNTSTKAEARQKIQVLIRERESEIRSLEPIRTFGMPVELYDGYENVSVMTGFCKQDPEPALEGKIKDYLLFTFARKSDVAVALFARNEDRAEASRILADNGFQEVKPPKLQGNPEKLISRLTSEIGDFEKDLRRIESDIESVRKQFADFIVASEEHLSIEVLKAETPLRIATSANSFVIDGWIPTARMGEIKSALDKMCCGLAFVQTVKKEKDEETPVMLKNPTPVRPFEFFINLVSTPKYDEIDPTLILFITFPIFFGFMVGDLGFGAGLIVLGAIIRLKLKGYPDLLKLGTIIIAAGLLASIFGAFVYCEAFGVPFHPEEEGQTSWEGLVNVPLHPLLEKMRDVLELLGFAVIAGWMHLTVGFAFGFVNNIHHNWKHALAKIAWIVILLGMFTMLMSIGNYPPETNKFMKDTLLSPLQPDVRIDLAGIEVAISSLVLIVIGIPILVVTEGGQALMEIIGLFTNLISYARLAALAVGKGAMAFAFNSMLLPIILGGSGVGGIIIAILAAVALVVVQLFFVFFLGSLSAGIQAMRLNYVEFFLKFFEGGGTDFKPLSYQRKYSVATK
jgi:V/A-type H+/Na+-transporting ATPase subunit I